MITVKSSGHWHWLLQGVLVALWSAVVLLNAGAQTIDRAQLLSEIINLRTQLRAATDPVQIAQLEGQLKVKETIFLQPDPVDLANHAAFLAQPDTGLIRLLPREQFDGVLATRGGGAYYSFARLTHEYGFGSDLSLQRGQFSVGFAGADFGFLALLGEMGLAEVTLDQAAVRYMAGFVPPVTEPEARLEQRRSSDGFQDNGFSYRDRTAAILGKTYAVRSVGYRTSDLLVAFRVLRQDSDGSLLLLWQQLKWFSTPQLNGGRIASVSAASYKKGVFAREAIGALFGENLSATTEVATGLPLPTSLAGVRVSFGGSSGGGFAPLFAVTPNQINFQVPATIANGWGFITVYRADGSSFTELVRIAPVAPGLFTANADGQGAPAAALLRINGGVQSYEPVARFDEAQRKFVPAPVDLGAGNEQIFLLLFGTGWRERMALERVSVKIGGVDAPVSYAGPQGLAGLDQINVALPRSLAGRGEVELTLTVDGQVANAVRINIK